MQLITVLAPLALSSIVASWKLEIYGVDGRKASFNGRRNTGCVDISFTPAIKVDRARFDPATALLPDPKSFELYVRKGCDGLSYRNGKGDHKLTPPRIIRSYKVTGTAFRRAKRLAEMQERGIEFDAEAEFFKRDAEAEAEAYPEPEGDDEPAEDDFEA